jgi:Nitrogenase molybdenum-iron protein, alpha and beta chains
MLDLTPKEITERKALRINPCKTCQPVGALYCALGVHKCMGLKVALHILGGIWQLTTMNQLMWHHRH